MNTERKNNKLNINSLLLVGASMLVLNACVPEDEVALQEENSKRVESLVSLYSQSFQQYSNRSINAVINSDLWHAQLLPEGVVDLSSSDFGSLNMGDAEDYLQSAHCKIGGKSHHITWFDKKDSDGTVFFKGLGKGQSGQTTTKIKGLIPPSSFGIMNASSIEMADGSVLSLSGACGSINIPRNSAIAAVMIPDPVKVTQTQEKLITRVNACGDDEEGGIMQHINAQYSADGNIYVDGTGFNSEDDVIASTGLTWTEVSNSCVAITEGISRVASNISVDAVNMASLSGLSGEISDSLKDNLSDLNCKDVNKTDNPEDLDDEENKEFDTCADAGDLELLSELSADEKRLLREEEEVILSACPAQPSTAGNVVINTSHADYTGIHNGLNGKTGSLSHGEMIGEIELKKITKFYEIIEDFGGGSRRGASSNGNCDENGCEIKTVSIEGVGIQCKRPSILSISCFHMFPNIEIGESSYTIDSPMIVENNDGDGYDKDSLDSDRKRNEDDGSGDKDSLADRRIDRRNEDDGGTSPVTHSVGDTVSGEGLNYSRKLEINGWSDVVKLIPNDAKYSGSWTQNNVMNCVFKQSRVVNLRCPSGYSGSKKSIEERKFTATSPSAVETWSDWSQITLVNKCKKNNSGRSRSSGGSAIDIDGDGSPDYSTYSSMVRSLGPTSVKMYSYSTVNTSCRRCTNTRSGKSISSGDSVLCTYFTFEKGWIDKKSYIGNTRFGKEKLSPETLSGYHAWAIPLVKYLRKHQGSLREKVIFEVLVKGWIHQNAYVMGYRKKGDWRGKILMATMKPICTLIGGFAKKQDCKSLWNELSFN